MKNFKILILIIPFFFNGLNLSAQKNIKQIEKHKHNLIIVEKNLDKKYKKIDKNLTHKAQKRLEDATESLYSIILLEDTSLDYYRSAKVEINNRFANLSTAQYDMLIFFLLSEVKNKLDSMNEMSEMTSQRLQMTMDRRSKIISTLSNILKKISSTQESIVRNIK